jgi:hypothetical protein
VKFVVCRDRRCKITQESDKCGDEGDSELHLSPSIIRSVPELTSWFMLRSRFIIPPGLWYLLRMEQYLIIGLNSVVQCFPSP